MPSLRSGIERTPYDMVAQLHEGERVVPKKDNWVGPHSMRGGWQQDNSIYVERGAVVVYAAPGQSTEEIASAVVDKFESGQKGLRRRVRGAVDPGRRTWG